IWEERRVIPIPKTKTPCELNDLRPISLLPTLSRVLEREVETQIRQHSNKYSLASDLGIAVELHYLK
ncbi:hypothetical protein JTB14_018714, partial [Gonioctena quinquepunctata]